MAYVIKQAAIFGYIWYLLIGDMTPADSVTVIVLCFIVVLDWIEDGFDL